MDAAHIRPPWLDKKINLSDCTKTAALLKDSGLATVCNEASCPNIGECFANGIATMLILGKVCTRNCAFCGIRKGLPMPPDPGEPARVAGALKRLGTRHAVITSVTRDDLADGGAAFFLDTVKQAKALCPGIKLELLIPDFCLDKKALAAVASSGAQIIGHNIETVPRLYAQAHAGADYSRSLGVLSCLKSYGGFAVKTGLMLGMGEMREEVFACLKDIKSAGCDYLSLGQYLSPGRGHYPVREYVRPEEFLAYEREARELGFSHVESGPYVRSSYHADLYRQPQSVGGNKKGVKA